MIDVGIVKRIVYRACIAILFGVLGYGMALLALLSLLPKILKNPRAALIKKKRTVPPPAYLDPSWGQHHSVQCNGIQLYYVAAGEQDKPLMVLLHGFPECWYSWRHQLRHFRDSYRVVAPDLRGFGRSSRPSSRVKDYHPEIVAEDIACFVKALGYDKCILAGHDWGGAIAWIVAQNHPEVVERLIVLDCPQPNVFEKYCRKDRSQYSRSKYMLIFNAWFLPEFILGLFDYGFINRILTRPPSGIVNKEQISEADLEVYKWSISRRGALTATINYYRCMPSMIAPIARRQGGKAHFSMPTLLLWGEKDEALDCRMAEEHERCGVCDDITVRVIPSCSHWIQQDKSDVVNQLIRAWLQAKKDSLSAQTGKESEEEED